MISSLYLFILSLVKEFTESILRNTRRVFISKKEIDILHVLKREGIYVDGCRLDMNICQALRSEIDELLRRPDTNVWRDPEGADERIYFANDISDSLREIFEDQKVRGLLREYTGIRNPVGFVLASRISYQNENLGSGGGWHRDSPYTHQFKMILFLNEVTEENGPFQYIRCSHQKRNVLLSYIRKIFKPGQYRFSNKSVANYCQSFGISETSMVCDTGTVVYADTKGIHRGKPLESGVRYAVFCYFWENKIPKHFEALRQNCGTQ